MIPGGRDYVEQMKLYERQIAAVGLHKLQGFRACWKAFGKLLS